MMMTSYWVDDTNKKNNRGHLPENIMLIPSRVGRTRHGIMVSKREDGYISSNIIAICPVRNGNIVTVSKRHI